MKRASLSVCAFVVLLGACKNSSTDSSDAMLDMGAGSDTSIIEKNDTGRSDTISPTVDTAEAVDTDAHPDIDAGLSDTPSPAPDASLAPVETGGAATEAGPDLRVASLGDALDAAKDTAVDASVEAVSADAGGSSAGSITLSVIANPDPAVPGALVTYEFKVSNTGGTELTNVVLTDTTQNVASVVYSEITGGGKCRSMNGLCAAGNAVTWPAFTLAPGQTQTVYSTSQVPAETADGTIIRNAATVTWAGGTVAQNRDVAVAATANLHVAMEEDHDPVKAGDQVTYTVRVGNTGTQTLPLSSAGAVTATIPVGTSFISASGGGTATNGVVRWNMGSMSAGASQHYTFTVAVDPSLADATILGALAQVLDSTTSIARAMTATEVRAASPLKLSVAVHPDPGVAGDLVTYEFKVSNTGSTTQANVVLSDVTQNAASVVFSVLTGAGKCTSMNDLCGAGSYVTWPAFTLAPGQTQTVYLTSVVESGVPNGTLIHNLASLAYTGGSVSQGYDLVVNSVAGLQVAMEEDHDPVKASDQVTYTVRVGNTGTQTLPLSSAGAVTATIPVGTSFVSASGGGTATNGVVRWNMGSVSAGASQHYTFTVAVDPSLADATILGALAQVLDSTTSIARAMTATEVRAASPLKLSVAVHPDPGVAGGLVTYEFKVSNTGSTTQTNVVLSDVTQNAASVVYSELTGDGKCRSMNDLCGAGNYVTWPAFTLAPGQTQTVSLTSVVESGAPNGALIHNLASLAYTGGSVSQGHDLVVNSAAGLRVAMEEDHDPVKAGDSITYTITVGNTAASSLPLSAAGGLTATIPVGTSFVSASGGGTAADGVVRWNAGSVGAGASLRYTFTVKVDSALADGTILGVLAQVLDSTTSVARAMTATEVRSGSALTLAMSVTPDPIAPRGLLTYVLIVTNTGPTALTNLSLSDVTQAGAAVVADEITGGGSCKSMNGLCGAGTIVSWPSFTLTSGQSQTVSVTTEVYDGTPDGTLIHNRAWLNHTAGTVSRELYVPVHQ